MAPTWAVPGLFNAVFDKTHSHGHTGENLLLNPLTNFFAFLIYLYGSLFSFMIVMNAKKKQTFPY